MTLITDFTTPPEPGNVYHSDALTLLQALPDNSVDAVITDPPAGIAFMGKEWDKDKGGRATWIAWMSDIASEALRVLKPGGHALVWAIPRTSHWTGMAWEDGGFEVRDKIYHAFGSGFPKSHDISKAIDREAGTEREVIGVSNWKSNNAKNAVYGKFNSVLEHLPITAPATPAAQEWDGWGSALKPAVEEWWLLRKPLTGTLAQNVQEWGTGGLNVDACRVETNDLWPNITRQPNNSIGTFKTNTRTTKQHPQGRWPANLIHDGSEEVTRLFPETGASKAGSFQREKTSRGLKGGGYGQERAEMRKKTQIQKPGYDDNGGSAARFFYVARASRSERGEGNMHPTVKPLELMEYFVRLVTRPGDLVLDPFAGSGTTLVAARNLNRRYIGCDITPEYVEIARERLAQPFTLNMFEMLGN